MTYVEGPKDWLEQGLVLSNYQVHYFKLWGNYYTTNHRRKARYSLDNKYWTLDATKSVWWKIKQVLSNKVYKLP